MRSRIDSSMLWHETGNDFMIPPMKAFLAGDARGKEAV
jgi:hypothetical protein